MFDRFTDRAKRVLSFARQSALAFNHDYIGTEHILVGLADEGQGVAANVLLIYNIDSVMLRNEVERIVKPSERPVDPTQQLPFTPHAKKVLELAMDEAANKLKHNYIGTEHLLLGLIAENEGIAAQILINAGCKLDELREEVLRFLGVEEVEKEKKPVDDYSAFMRQRHDVVAAVKPREGEGVLGAVLRVAESLDAAIRTLQDIRMHCVPMGTDCGDSAVVAFVDAFLERYGA